MKPDKYSVTSDRGRHAYEFLSEAPKGTIKKVMKYQEVQDGVFNPAFGDWDEITQKIVDSARTNNNDRDKVLATVASTVNDFMKHDSECGDFC